jgi:SAM-dependent methyltransferase
MWGILASGTSNCDDATQIATLEPSDSAVDLFDVFVNCPLCGSPDYQLLFTHKECGKVVRCAQCQLKFIRSRSTASMPELRRGHTEPLPDADALLQKQDSQVDDFLDILNRIKGYQANGKLLELGCLTGHFLAIARKAGYEGIGIEPDPWAAEYARREFGLSIHETPAPDLHFDDRTFDVIAMFHVMEHLTRPMETLLALHRILKDMGLLAIEIPIIDTLFPMTMGRRHRHYVFDHTLFLSRKTAAEFLRKAGFKILHSELTGRRIRLARLAWAQSKTTKSFGQFLEHAFKALHIQERSVHVNLRDNYRIYCRKAY